MLEEESQASPACLRSAGGLAALSASETLAVVERSYAARRAHLDWLVNAAATGRVRSDKIERLRAVVRANHRPSAEALASPPIEASGLPLSQQVERVEAGWKRYNHQLADAIGGDDFKTIFGHSPETLDNPLRVFWPRGDRAP